jgi:hypothetical protein
MSIMSVRKSYRTSPTLKVSAPAIPIGINVTPIWPNVVPAIEGLHCSEPFIEAKCTEESPYIGSLTIRADMPRILTSPYRCQAWRVELEYFLKSLGIDRLASFFMVGPRG